MHKKDKTYKKGRLGAFWIGMLGILIILATFNPVGIVQSEAGSERIETVDLDKVTTIVLTDDEDHLRKGNSLLMDGEVMLQSANTFSERDFDVYDIILAEYNALANNPNTFSLLEDLFSSRRQGKVFGLFSTVGITYVEAEREVLVEDGFGPQKIEHVLVNMEQVRPKEHELLINMMEQITGQDQGSPACAFVVDYRGSGTRTLIRDYGETKSLDDIVEYLSEGILSENELASHGYIVNGFRHTDDRTEFQYICQSTGTIQDYVMKGYVMSPEHHSSINDYIFLSTKTHESASPEYEKTNSFWGPYFDKVDLSVNLPNHMDQYEGKAPTSYYDMSSSSATAQIGLSYIAGAAYSKTWDISDVEVKPSMITGEMRDFEVETDFKRASRFSLWPLYSSPATLSYQTYHGYSSTAIKSPNVYTSESSHYFSNFLEHDISVSWRPIVGPVIRVRTTSYSINRYRTLHIDALPSILTDLRVESVDDNGIELSWKRPAGAEYDEQDYLYEIFLNNEKIDHITHDEGYGSQQRVYYTVDNDMLDPDLLNFKVRASNYFGEGDFSNIVTVDMTPPSITPPVIDGHRSFDSGGWVHHITWNHDDTEEVNDFPIARYGVYRKTPSSSSYTRIGWAYPSGADSNGDIDYSVSAYDSGRYYYRVKTVVVDNNDDDTYSDYSNTISLFGGTGSGGGCPYVSPWNGEDYVRENNLLIASEYKEGVVEDYYLLENHLEPVNDKYQLKIEEFKNTENYFDRIRLYVIDHQEGVNIGTTPQGELVAYKNPISIETLYDERGDTIDTRAFCSNGDSLYIERDSEIYLDFESMNLNDLSDKKLVIRGHNYGSIEELYNEGDESDPHHDHGIKGHLELSLRSGDYEIELDLLENTEIYPRNHPSDIVIPMTNILEQLPYRISETEDFEFVLKNSADIHYGFIGVAEPSIVHVKTQEARLLRAVFNGETDITRELSMDGGNMIRQVPGDEILLVFDNPVEVMDGMQRSFILYSKGYYHLYGGG